MSNNPVVWFEIYVDDMARARAFYEAVLGVELSSLDVGDELQMLTFPMGGPDSSGSGGALVHHPDMPAGGNTTIVYFRCDDCDVEAARIEANGGTLLRGKMSIGEHGFVAHAKDTEGNQIALHSTQ